MKLGVVSDVHCDDVALRRALEFLDGRVDEVWCAGDILLQYRFSKPTVALLRAHEVTAIAGNHDAVLLGPGGERARSGLRPDDEDLAWLAALPARHEVVLDGRRVLMVHGNPWHPPGDYLPAHDRRWRRADDLAVDVLIVGHTHEPMAETFGSTLVVNPGSISEPRQLPDRHPTFAVVDLDGPSAVIERLDDP